MPRSSFCSSGRRSSTSPAWYHSPATPHTRWTCTCRIVDSRASRVVQTLPCYSTGMVGGWATRGPVSSLLRKLIREADIRTAKGRRPRVHDLRFTFAVNALLRWYRTGIDVQARLPALSIYMGHSSVVSTQYYLTFVDDLAHAACERFDQHCSRFLQPHSSSGEVR
jgi:hypothetical protein